MSTSFDPIVQRELGQWLVADSDGTVYSRHDTEAAAQQAMRERFPAKSAQRSAGPWHLVEATEYHGPYVTSDWGQTVCDCYVMSSPGQPSVRNGGLSRPVPFSNADANARLIAAAPDLLAALRKLVNPNGGLTGTSRDHPYAIAARAAIAAAEGAR